MPSRTTREAGLTHSECEALLAQGLVDHSVQLSLERRFDRFAGDLLELFVFKLELLPLRP